MTLESKKSLSPSIRLLRFTFDSSMVFGLPVGKHVYLKLPQEKLYKDMPVKSLMRAYTPSDSGPGFVEFIVKIYFPESGSNFGGAFTQRLDKVRDRRNCGHQRTPWRIRVSRRLSILYSS
jgi:nitrate reductase (NAD(P)H)